MRGVRDPRQRDGRAQSGYEHPRVPQQLGESVDRIQLCYGESVSVNRLKLHEHSSCYVMIINVLKYACSNGFSAET